MRDSCPHRGIPLSVGWFDGERVQCRYHGWEFEPCSGRCELIPSLTSGDHLDATKIYATAFPDMHRELYAFYVIGNTVVVELALQGTHKGLLELPIGIIQPTGKKMNAPCCDVFQLINGKIKSFNCYPSGTVVLSQLGVLQKLGAFLR